MSKQSLKKLLPDPSRIKEHRSLRFLGDLIHEPNLWHINRRSISRAFFIGIFACFLPLPGHMAMAAVMALMGRANLPLSVVLVWVNNPLTMGPIYYAGYLVGTILLETPAVNFEFELSWQWFSQSAESLWLPLFLGCFVSGLLLGLVAAVAVYWLWCWKVSHQWKSRQRSRVRQIS